MTRQINDDSFSKPDAVLDRSINEIVFFKDYNGRYKLKNQKERKNCFCFEQFDIFSRLISILSLKNCA